MDELKQKNELVQTNVIIILNKFFPPGSEEGVISTKTLLSDSEEFYAVHRKATERSLCRFSNGFYKITHLIPQKEIFLGKLEVQSYDVYCPTESAELIALANEYRLSEADIKRFYPMEVVKPENNVLVSNEQLVEAIAVADDISTADTIPGEFLENN